MFDNTMMPEMGMPEAGMPIEEAAPAEGAGQVTFSALDLPQIVDWEEGQEYEITARIVMSSKGEDDGVTSATFDIISVDSGEWEEPEAVPPIEEIA